MGLLLLLLLVLDAGSACSSEVISIYGADWLTSIPWPAIVLLTTPTKTIIAIVLLK